MTAVGQHLIADLWGCHGLADPGHIETALKAAVSSAGVTLLGLKLHHFGPQQGVTGVALLAESHISIHTWPEHGLAAVDIFLCGDTAAVDAALASLITALGARRNEITRLQRGQTGVASLPATHPSIDT